MSTTTPKSAGNSPSPSTIAKSLLTLVGSVRAVFGIGCLTVPSLAIQFIGLKPTSFSPEASLIVRQFGVREIVVGGFLLYAERKRRAASPTNGGDEVRRAIWWNVATDALDAVALVIAYGVGSLQGGAVFNKMLGTALVMVFLGVETAVLYR
ncbi:hypothetical protein B0H66DRAFT_547227 [Apodospora peruviana]|uniref:Uncharacterized protein n=1 Tax=Apodospora peruviana TaxID=516989 RepID=A0AAE0MA43_9PEZI|nr:hypothetical protein B0H66DRAFT_547227 [Apodospora peruviana]